MNKLMEFCLNITDGEHGSVTDVTDSKYYFLNNNNITDSGISINNNDRRISKEEFERIHKRTQLETGDVVIASCGTIGKAQVIRDTSINYDFSRSVGIIKCNKDILLPEFLYFYLKNPETQKRIARASEGAVQKHFYIGAMEDFEVEIPDIKTQQEIIVCLSAIEAKISNNNAICSDLESMAKLLYDYWFVQFDFPDENGRPYKSSGGKMVWNEELKREIPEGWKVAPFEKCIASINTGLNPRDNFQLNTGGKIRYLTVKNLTKEGTIDFTSCDMIDEDARAIVHRRSDIQVGDILFASISPLGRCHVITETPEDWDINESVFSIRPNYQNMTSIFLYMTFMSDVFIKKAEGSSAGSVFKGIRISELQGLNTILPPKAILNAFDEQTKNIFKMKAIAFAENQQLAALRDFLLPMLMNGQVKVADKTSEE